MFLPLAFFCAAAAQSCIFYPSPAVTSAQLCQQIISKQKDFFDANKEHFVIYSLACIPVQADKSEVGEKS